MSKDQVRRAIHVKSISSAHKWDFPRCQAKTTKALLWFLSLTLRFRDKELELLAVLANTSFFSFLLSVWRNQNYCLKPKKMPSRFIFPCGLLQHLLYWSTLLSYFIQPLLFFYLFRAEKQEREREVGRRVNRRRGAEK